MNPFDQHMAGIQNQHELGFNLFKSVKKLGKKIDKKITRPVAKAVKTVAKSPLGKIALVAAGAFVLGPSVVGLVKSAAPAIGRLVTGGSVATVAKIAAPAIMQQKMADNVAKNTEELAKQNAIAMGLPPVQSTQVAIEKTVQASTNAQIAAAKVANDPGFLAAQQQMLNAGYTPQQITDAYAKSDAYRQAALPQVANTVYPQAYQQFINEGYDSQTADKQARLVSKQTAINAVDQIQKGGIPTWAYAAGGATILLLAVNMSRGR